MNTGNLRAGNAPRVYSALLYPLVMSTALLAFAGCTTARMACPPQLSSSTREMPVEGRKVFGISESFRFGPFKVEDVHRGWRVTTSWGILGYGSSKAEQPFEFKLAVSPDSKWESHCASGVRWKKMELRNFMDSGGVLDWELSSHGLFTCESVKSGTDVIWKMVMKQETSDMVMNGVLSDGKSEIVIKGTRELQGGAWPLTEPTGYLFHMNGKIVGGVEVINAGAVWVNDELAPDTQAGIASASAALLLCRDLKD